MLLGIEIGGTKLQLVLGNDQAAILERRKLPVDPTRGAAGIRAQIQQTLPELIGNRTLRAIGVGFGGPVDARDFDDAITIERLPNGNLVVEGEKWLKLNQGDEFAQISGVIRPFDIATGKSPAKKPGAAPNYQDVFGEAMVRFCDRNSKLVGITAAMPRRARLPWPISRRFGEPIMPVSPTENGGKL